MLVPNTNTKSSSHLTSDALLPSTTLLPPLVLSSIQIMNMCVDSLAHAEVAVGRTMQHIHSLNAVLDSLQLPLPVSHHQTHVATFLRILTSVPHFNESKLTPKSVSSVFHQFKLLRDAYRVGWGTARGGIVGGSAGDRSGHVAHFCEGCSCCAGDDSVHPTTPVAPIELRLSPFYSMWYRSELMPAEFAALSVLTGMPLPARAYLDLEDRRLTEAKLRAPSNTNTHHQPPTLCFPCFVAMGVALGSKPFTALSPTNKSGASPATFMASAMRVVLGDTHSHTHTNQTVII
jgi:hypothetical protein